MYPVYNSIFSSRNNPDQEQRHDITANFDGRVPLSAPEAPPQYLQRQTFNIFDLYASMPRRSPETSSAEIDSSVGLHPAYERYPRLTSHQFIQSIKSKLHKHGISEKQFASLAKQPLQNCSIDVLNSLNNGLEKLIRFESGHPSILIRAHAAGFTNDQIFSIFKRSSKKFSDVVTVFDRFISVSPTDNSFNIGELLQEGFNINQIKNFLSDSRGNLKKSIEALEYFVTDQPTHASLLRCLKNKGFDLNQISGFLMYSSGKLSNSVGSLKSFVIDTPLRQSTLSCAFQMGFSTADIAKILQYAKGLLNTSIIALDEMVRAAPGQPSFFQRLNQAGFSKKQLINIMSYSNGKLYNVINVLEKAEFALCFANDNSKSAFLEQISRLKPNSESASKWIDRANTLMEILNTQELNSIVLDFPEMVDVISPEDVTDDLFDTDSESLSSEGWVYDHLQFPPAASST